MFVAGNLCFALGRILGIILDFYLIVLLVRAVLSWFDPNPYGTSAYRPRMPEGMSRFYMTVKYWVVILTEPLLKPIRRKVKIPGLPVDIAFLILVLSVIFLKIFLVGTLFDLGARLR